jgi:hypothetical protein
MTGGSGAGKGGWVGPTSMMPSDHCFSGTDRVKYLEDENEGGRPRVHRPAGPERGGEWKGGFRTFGMHSGG